MHSPNLQVSVMVAQLSDQREKRPRNRLTSVCFFPGLQAVLIVLTELLHHAPAITFNFMVYLLHSAHGTDYS